jgi:hypothetical protein
MKLSRLQLFWVCVQGALPLAVAVFTQLARPDLIAQMNEGWLQHSYSLAVFMTVVGVSIQFVTFLVLASLTSSRPWLRTVLLGLGSVGPFLACTLPACLILLLGPILNALMMGGTDGP